MATAASSNITHSTSKMKVIWSWQSNQEPWNEKQNKKWTRYSDLENTIIEEAYQNGEGQVQLAQYIIDFDSIVQINKSDKRKKRPLKRSVVEVEGHLREQRFFYPEKPIKSFESSNDDAMISAFIEKWISRYTAIAHYTNRKWPEIVEQAAKGILKESKVLNQEADGYAIANSLRKVKNKTEDEIIICAIRLYTAETFLYKLINSVLRENDTSKIDTLGAYCFLLHKQSRYNDQYQIVYRGANCTEAMINDYKQSVNKWIKWMGFTSTSRDRRKAEIFGNTLFVIELVGRYIHMSDISKISVFPDEQEVLLDAGTIFEVITGSQSTQLIKNQHLSKAATEQAAHESYLRSTPILNRLRVRASDHTTAASSSSCISSIQPGLTATTSKNKQIT
ncbi:unnamed protein product, partial [Rotaria magnacalcarata]